MQKKVLAILTSLLLLLSGGNAQDLHFSQFMQTPLLINPANTGFIPDGDYRLGVNYRNQWSSLSAFPYKTISAFGDWQLLQNSDQTGWLGAGGLILRDVAGTSLLTSTKVYGSVAYHQMINNGSSAEYAQQYLEMLQEQKGVSLMELEKMAADRKSVV